MNELLEFLHAQGFTDFEPILDGRWHRFSRDGNNNCSFWGIEYENPKYIIAYVKDWKADEEFHFTSNQPYSNEEAKVNLARLEETRRNRDIQEKEDEKQASLLAIEKWNQATSDGESAYLNKKGFESGIIKLAGLRTAFNSWGDKDLIVPAQDITGKIWSYQKIQPDGQKFFQPGGRIQGCFFQIGEITPQTEKIYLSEGIATALSIWLATGVTTISCFNAANLSLVAKDFRKKYPNLPMIICGDDDRFTVVRGENKNTGKIHAAKAAAVCQGTYVLPTFGASSKGTDLNDVHCEQGLEEVKKQLSVIALPNPKEFIKTQNTGFHRQEITKKGDIKWVPDYDDLLKYFKKLYDYKLLDTSQKCFIWNGKYYQECEEAFIEGFAEEHFFPKPMNHIVNEFTGKVYRQNSCVRSSEWFSESTKSKINFQNGVFDKETGMLEPHNSAYGFRYVLKYNYDPNAKCPTYDKFSKDISLGDEGWQKVVNEYGGYILSGDECWLEKALFLEGDGANGKSTLAFVLKELAGQDNYTTFSIGDFERLDNRYAMDGKLANIAEETPRLALTETSLFKDLASGGDIQARPLFKKAYKFHNRAKLVFASNDLPKTRDTSFGLSRKMFIVPFRAKFTDEIGNKDVGIKAKLKAELPGIFNKMWAAYTECKKRGYITKAKAIEDAIESYKDEIDPMKVWVQTNIQTHPIGNGMDTKFQTIKKLYADYKMEMDSQGEKYPLTYTAFCKKLSGLIKEYDKRKLRMRVDGKPEYVLIATTRETGENF